MANKAYEAAGVDVTAGYESVELMKEYVKSTYTEGVIGGIGGFGGMFALAKCLAGMSDPVAVSGADGVGTKLKLAFWAGKYDTVGIDLVAMVINDIICCGAKPAFFLDYIACGKNYPERIAEIVAGVADGCRQAGVALIGGETAEMPGVYGIDEFDMAGFGVGFVDRSKIIDGSTIKPGDVLIGLPSSGVHSNGFSLIRKIYSDLDKNPDLLAQLLTPTKIYAQVIEELKKIVNIKGMSNITGGGWFENIPRMLPLGLTAVVDAHNIETPEIFQKIARDGEVSLHDMFNTFNMGVGMVICVSPEDAQQVMSMPGSYQVIGHVSNQSVSLGGESGIFIEGI